jgi:curved DNA-binding protein CbpA
MLLPKPAQLPEPSASGSLAKKPLAHLLIYALDRKLTGTFELADDRGAAVHIVVAAGMVARIGTQESVTYLGHILYENGFIDDNDLSTSLAEVAASKRLHGQVLLAKGKIDRAQLAEGLRQQRSRKLQHAFALPPQTSFAFYTDIDLVGERPDDVEPLNPLTCIWRGVREHPSWDHVRATITRVGGRPLRLLDGVALERLGLDDDERGAAECLRMKNSTIPELAIVGGLTIQRTDLLAYFLVITKQVEVAERVGTSAHPSERRLSVTPMRVNTPGVAFNSGEYARKISFTMSAVTPDSQTIRIPSPIPDRIPSPMPGRLSSPMPGRLSSPVPARSNSPMPHASQSPGRHSSVGPPQPSTPPRSMSPMPGRLASPVPPRVSSAPPGAYHSSMPPASDLARKKSIVDRAKWIDQEDYYKMLTVSREATTDDIRAAFLRAAKVWHPDTLPASISEVRIECEKVFARLTTAYETLVAPEKRRAYERSLGAKIKESAEADHLLSQAEMHVTLGDRGEAEALVRKALVASPELPEAMALLAFLEASSGKKSQQPEHLRKCLQMADMAIGKDPMCRRAHYYRAELKKRMEDHEGAIRDLRIAVTNDPDDVEAQRELRAYEKKLRDGTIQIRSLSPFGGTKKPDGFFDRLRGKK